jgi:hypothetical protein
MRTLLHLNRRQLLGSSAVVLLALHEGVARGAIVKSGLPWKPGAAAFEYLCGTSGQAGNVKGTIQPAAIRSKDRARGRTRRRR